MKYLVFVFLLNCIQLVSFAQTKSGAQQFWTELQKHCGKAYEGKLTENPEGSGTFKDQKLVMHVRSCGDSVIRIPFMVGENRSRTWVLTLKNDLIQLKHDHRHEDGSEDAVTQYGGLATNSGSASLQIFPADVQTAILLPNAASNVWWISLTDKVFTYNLRRLNSERIITVTFDLSKAVDTPAAPWGSQ
ncbi:hypothetical protein SanaruYs_02650 [Chryseotalea sanaruensis]|uniref:Secreted protein n=1 Tax=Chryseotalea sanaruensis TaxID=2482724 RepID=A0A401U5E5_9BACT|nr:hypothetical protein [Chryseotalea sanaruensis]GCC50050.1 hypothetical protein SanaruYs_02650 [Chryseotalea sanaruensis]